MFQQRSSRSRFADVLVFDVVCGGMRGLRKVDMTRSWDVGEEELSKAASVYG